MSAGGGMMTLSYHFSGDCFELMPVYGDVSISVEAVSEDAKAYEESGTCGSDSQLKAFGDDGSFTEGFRDWMWRRCRNEALGRAAYANASDYSDMLIYDRKCGLK